MTTTTTYPRPLRATFVRTKRARAASGARKNTMEIAAKKRKVICFSDFDGTIFMQDTGHILFDRYGCGARRRKVLDDQIKSGKRGFRAAFEEMWGSLRVPFDEAVQALKRSLGVDQDFEAFYAYCSANEVPFSIVSAGLKPVLKQVLNYFLGEEEAENIDIISNDAIIAKDGSKWKPVWRHDCDLGHDKAKSINQARDKARSETVEPLVMFIGDGVSDLPVASAADILFARRGLQLEGHCVEHGIAYIPYDTFGDIQEVLEFVLKDLQDALAGSGISEGAKAWRRVAHKNKVSFAVARAQCQIAVRTPKEAGSMMTGDYLIR